MFDFIKLQYQMGKIDAETVRQLAISGKIAFEQAEEIIRSK